MQGIYKLKSWVFLFDRMRKINVNDDGWVGGLVHRYLCCQFLSNSIEMKHAWKCSDFNELTKFESVKKLTDAW